MFLEPYSFGLHHYGFKQFSLVLRKPGSFTIDSDIRDVSTIRERPDDYLRIQGELAVETAKIHQPVVDPVLGGAHKLAYRNSRFAETSV